MPGAHEPPAVQAAHDPLRHTAFAPHNPDVPSATLPVSTQVAVPVAQDMVPFWQGLGGLPGVQLPVAVQGVQAPLSQTSPAPHTVPLPAFPVALQTI